MKIFTRNLSVVAIIILFAGVALPTHAQFVKKVYENNNEFYTAVTKDPNGNIYAVRSGDGVHASVIKYAPNSTSFSTLFSGLGVIFSDESNAGFSPWGLAVNSHGDVYVTTNLSPGNTGTGTNVVNGVALPNHGNVIKLASNNGYNGTVYTASVFLSAGLFYTSLAFDGSDNLYVVQTDNTSLSHYTVRRYPAGSTSGTELLNDLNDDNTDNYPHGLAIASNGDIYVCDAGQILQGGTSGHKGGVRHYPNSGGTYSSHTNVSLNTYPMALALDGSGNLYVNETDGSAYTNYRLNKYNATSHALIAGNITTPLLTSSGIHPDGIAAINNHDIYVAGGGNPSDFFELIGPATTPASGINFTATATTSTTINWTNGDGASRAVFVAQASSGTPSPANSTNYTASTTFGSGTQAGAGWYCVYNGTGTSVNVTGLTVGTTYRAMVVEYNGTVTLTDENYLTTSNAGNTANVTTLSPTTINSINRVTGQFTNASSVNFLATFGTTVTGVTASNFSVTATGVTGVTNANIGTPTTGDGGITWTVPVTTGTGDGTIQLNLANATGLSKTITTSLPFAGQTYTIDKTAPTITIGSPSATITKNGPITYTVTYADANFNASTLATGNITLNKTSTANGTLAVTGSGTTRTITISGITGDGTLGISIAAGTASDLAGNSAPAAGPSTTFIVDNTPPTVVISSTATDPTSVSPIPIKLTFSENVTGFTAANVSLSSGTISGFTGSGSVYTFNIVTAGFATYTTNIAAAQITDLAGNTNTVAASFTIVYASPLAVQFLSFTAVEKSAGVVYLDWKIASEQNNDHYLLERSSDGTVFNPLSIVQAQAGGNSSSEVDYTYIDNNPVTGNNFYRLTQVDKDGRTKQLSTQIVRIRKKTGDWTIYPNPVSTNFSITIPIDQTGKKLVSIFDAAGKLIYSNQVMSNAGKLDVQLDKAFASGMYTVQVEGLGAKAILFK
jgi:hypothetical protein